MKNAKGLGLTLLLTVTLFFNPCSLLAGSGASPQQAMVDRLADGLAWRYEFLKGPGAMSGPEFFQNMQACQKLGAGYSQCYKTKITLTNGETAIAASDIGWQLFYNDAYLLLDHDSEEFDVKHVNGGLYVITPTADFEGFKAGEAKEIVITSQYNRCYISDFYPRAFFTAEGAEARVIANTDTDVAVNPPYAAPILTDSPKNWMTNPSDTEVLQTAATREATYAPVAAAQASQAAVDAMILPTPRALVIANGEADLSGGVQLKYPKGFPKASQYEINNRLVVLGVNVGKTGYTVTASVNPQTVEALGSAYAVSGAYQLTIEADGATIVGYDNAGVFYGFQSIAALIQSDFDQGAEHQKIPFMTVNDSPRMAYRGLNIDVARHFVSVSEMQKLIRTLAAYKGNKLHLHLTDNEGWRIEIDGLPELTEVGSRRLADNHDETVGLDPAFGSGPDTDNLGSGFYSISDYQALVQLADANFIQVIPEIDMPAHIRAGIYAMEARYKKYVALEDMAAATEYRLKEPADTSRYMSAQFYNDSYLNPCQVSTFNFVRKVVTELAAMHATAGQPLTTFHAGGDEVADIYLGSAYQNIGGSNPYQGYVDLSQWDQPWSKSPACNQLSLAVGFGVEKLMGNFFRNVSSILNGANIHEMMLWNDGAKDVIATAGLSTSLTVDNWAALQTGDGTGVTASFLNEDVAVVLAPSDYLYFDAPYEVDPAESGTWPITRNDDTQKVFSFAPENLPQNAETSTGNWAQTSPVINNPSGVKGMEGNLWGELMRTDASRDKFGFPRMLAMLERAWFKAPWELDYVVGRTFSSGTAQIPATHYVNKQQLAAGWADFASLLGKKELAKLDKMQVRYRVPVAGGIMEDGKLTAYTAFPGLTVQYQAEVGGPWLNYDANNRPAAAVAVRTLSALGNRAGLSATLP